MKCGLSRMALRFACACLAWWAAACGVQEQPAAAAGNEVVVPERRDGVPRVLFVGNSLSFGVPRMVAKGSARAGSAWDAGRVAHEGWSLDRHATDPQTLATIRGGEWDVVVLQEQSRLPSVPVLARWRMMPAAAKLVSEIRAAGAVPVFYQTWGYRDGDPLRSGDDFHKMNARVREGYRRAGAAAAAMVVPAGDAWEREVSAGTGGRLFREDGKHPSPAGDELTARVFIEHLEALRR